MLALLLPDIAGSAGASPLTPFSRSPSPAPRAARTALTSFTFTGLGGEPNTLDPLLSQTSDLDNLTYLYVSHLVETDSRGDIIPDIAVRVPSQANGDISRDGRTIVFHLRRGVTWQDGAPLTARDVVFTYRAVMNPANNVVSRVGYDRVDRISAPDPWTVRLHLRHPFAPIVVLFSNRGIVPSHLFAKDANLNHAAYNELPIGSGPFRVVQWRRGESITFAANPTYWRGKPHIDRLVYRITPDPNTRLLQLQTGDADAYFDADPQLLPQLARFAGFTIALTPVNDLHALLFNLRDSTVGDPRVREAIARAIDRRKLIAVATHGSGLLIDGDQPRNGWAYAAASPRIAYDPATSRRLLDDAGWHLAGSGVREKDGRELDVELAISPQAVNGSALVATIVQRYLHDVGITVEIKQYPPNVMFAPKAAGGILTGGRYQIAYSGWWLLQPDPDDAWQFACDQRPPAGLNWTSWCTPRADASIRAATQTYDRALRKRDYAVVEAELRRDLPELTLWQVAIPDVYRPALQGFAPSPFGSTFWNAWAWSLTTGR